MYAKYKAEGFRYYRWHSSNDEKVRKLHRELAEKENNKHGINGTNIFDFENPPVIYEQEKDGKIIRQDRGNPGQTYNCRCVASPYIDKDLFKRRHEMYKQMEKMA